MYSIEHDEWIFYSRGNIEKTLEGTVKEVLDFEDNFVRLFYRLNLLLEKFNSEMKLSLPVTQIFAVLNKMIFLAFGGVGICGKEHFNIGSVGSVHLVLSITNESRCDYVTHGREHIHAAEKVG